MHLARGVSGRPFGPFNLCNEQTTVCPHSRSMDEDDPMGQFEAGEEKSIVMVRRYPFNCASKLAPCGFCGSLICGK